MIENNENEELDALFLDSDNDGDNDIIYLDADSDGLVDTIGYDADNDGLIDTVSYDTDGDGAIDEYFEHRNCEHVWGDADGDGFEECQNCGLLRSESGE
jgi:hypothetical protein